MSPVSSTGGSAPLLLLPVRIETRFIDGASENNGASGNNEVGEGKGGSELWVRVYPDQIMVNGHHPELTAAEVTAGNAYWDAVWRAGDPPADQDAVQAPWRGLVTRYGAPRAAWIVSQTTPVNIAQRPAAPTPPNGTPNPVPQPPSPPVTGSAWDSPAVASLLPQAWTVVLESGTSSASYNGSPVTPSLAVSLSAADPSLAAGFPDGLPVDQGMRWLVDFDAAVAAGMALRIPLTPAQRQAGFDRVLVYGLCDQEAGSLADLLNAHHYSDGLTFAPQGSPTRNTSAAPSGYSRADPGALTSFAVELGPPLTGDQTADGPVAAGLLGVPVPTFDHVRFADRHDMRDSRDMVTALWPATLGYFLRQLGDGGLTETQVEQARTWTIANMRPRGPLPAVTAGQQPYGILPVTSTAMFEPEGDDQTGAAVLRLVRALLPAWTASAAGAPHVGATPGDPDTDLAHVLGMDASSSTFRGRHFLGDHLLWNLAGFLGLPASGVAVWWQQHLAAGRGQLDALGYLDWDPRVIHGALFPSDFPVSSPTVTAGPLSETDPLPDDATLGGEQVNYITWLRSAAIDDIRAGNYPGPAVPDTLLYKILRQSVLLDYVTLAQFAQVGDGELALAQTRESELVGMTTADGAAPALAEVTPWDVLARPVSAEPSLTWAQYLVALQPPPGSPFARLAQLRDSMDRLAALPTAELDRLLTETLDTCSHRLDSWVTALATSRLSAGADAGAGSPRLGGYSFVENLRPAAAQAPADQVTAGLVADVDERRARLFPGAARPLPPTQAPAGNGRFIHAPSMTQAATAAVLRSGYLSHQGGPEDGLLAVDLSSDRVRAALFLLAGVQRGQPLGALLGYQLETALHDAGLDAYIQPLRNAYPLVAGKLTAGGGADAGMSQVVDGLALDRARQAGLLPPGGDWGTGTPGLPGPGADQNALLAQFAALDDTVDAISDVGVAEAVYQTMRGNPDRAGATFDGISQAEQLPDPQVVPTPRTGTDYTQRLCAVLAGPPALAAAWAGIAATPRAAAEPWLDAWVSALLPDPSAVSGTVSYTDGGTPVTAVVRLSDLAAGPLDVLAMSRISAQGGRSELDARLIYHVVPPAATDVTVSYPQEPAPGIGFADLLNVARTVAGLLAGARALAASDLVPASGTAVPPGIDVVELNGRASAARVAVTALVTSLAGAAAGSAAPDDARDAMTAAAGYGLPGAIPPSRRGSGPDPRLAAQAAPLRDAMAARAATMTGITLATDDPAPALAVLDAAFGQSLLVLPRFAPPDAALAAALGADPALLGATDVALARWRQQLTHVRDGVARFDLALLLAEVVAGATAPPLRVAQLPAVPGDRWLALPLAPGASPGHGRLSIVAAVTGDVSVSSWAGLYLDGWPERLPDGTQTTGVAFNAAEPAARAPAALLLAACPSPRAGWNDQAITAVLRETLALARIRAVDLGSLTAAGQVLPALYFPFNLEDDTVSMPLMPIVINRPTAG
ncbi:MAG: hypothetical protein ACRDP7_33740 [Trebonia sp.]